MRISVCGLRLKVILNSQRFYFKQALKLRTRLVRKPNTFSNCGYVIYKFKQSNLTMGDLF